MVPQSDAGRRELEPWLEQAVARLIDDLNPVLILLFGSCARGTATRHSDLDLLVVWPTRDGPLDRIGRVLTLLADSPLPVEVIAYTPDELASRRHTPFMRRVLAEGRVLYEC